MCGLLCEFLEPGTVFICQQLSYALICEFVELCLMYAQLFETTQIFFVASKYWLGFEVLRCNV